MEIERRFRICSLPSMLDKFRKKEIVQGYVCLDPTVRIRQSNGDYYLTVKQGAAPAREEFEISLTQAQYQHLLTKLDCPPLEKTRYLIPLEDGLTAELDIFKGRLSGLVIVEVEFSSLDEMNRFLPPPWFGKDITSDRRYSNSSLASLGLPEEPGL